MPIFNAPILTLDQKECKRYAGLASKTTFPDELVAKACMEALTLISPRGIWQLYDYDNQRNVILSDTPVLLKGEGIVKHLQAAKKVAVLAVTIGLALEIEVTRHFETGEYTLGLLLDAAGTTAVEANADYIENLITKAAASQGFSPLFRFSPGYGKWDITSQPEILALAGGNAINVKLTSSCILTPRKSVTAVIGLVPHVTTGNQNSACKSNSCQACNQINCLARKEPPTT